MRYESYEARVINTPDEHGQRPQPGDIVIVAAHYCAVLEDNVARLDELSNDELEAIEDPIWITVYAVYRDGTSQALIDLNVDQTVMNRRTLPNVAEALVDLLIDLPLGRLDRFACQVHGLPTT
jgi:hypothetical protein